MQTKKQGDVYIVRDAVPGESAIFSANEPGELERQYKEYIDSQRGNVYETIAKSAARNPKAIAVRERTGENTYTTMTFEELLGTARHLAFSLHQHNFCPPSPEVVEGKKMQCLGVFLENRAAALICDIACFYMGYMVVSLVPDAQDLIENFVRISPFDTVVIQPAYAKILLDKMKDKTIRPIKNFVMTEELDEKTHDELAKDFGVQFYSFKTIIEEGKTAPEVKPKVEMDDIAILVSTSGSTGYPKGAIARHKVMISLILGFFSKCIKGPESTIVNVTYAFASMKLVVVLTLVSGGAVTFFGSRLDKTFDVMRETNPSFMIFAPLFLHQAYPSVMQNIAQLPAPQSAGLTKAIEAKIAFMKAAKQLVHPELDKHLAPLRQKLLGTGLKHVYYVGAAIRNEVLWFFRALMCCPFRTVYGLSESGGWCTMGGSFDDGDSIGSPMPGYDLKVVDCPDKGYSINDVINGKPVPRGHLMVRGSAVCSGYFKDPEKSKEIFTADGWLKTNDIVRLDTATYSMSIIDRVNNITKLSNEEFVAAEQLEKLYEASQYLNQIYINVSHIRDYIVAVAFPKKPAVMKWAEQKGIKGDFETLCKNPEFNKEVVKDLADIARAKNLNYWEYIIKVYLTTEQFTQANGELTFTYKLKRPNIFKKYEEIVTEMYNTPVH